MGWKIECTDTKCDAVTYADNIVDLIQNYTDANGWFICNTCKQRGYIAKHFELQEKDEIWEPYLRGIIPLGKTGDIYQPFVFIVSDDSTGLPHNIWFSYYKDLRNEGGKLKLGYGPGGPPVLETSQIISILKKMIEIGIITENEILKQIQKK